MYITICEVSSTSIHGREGLEVCCFEFEVGLTENSLEKFGTVTAGKGILS